MVIKASAASEIRALVQALAGTDDVRREAAIARLAVIGPRAVPHLLSAYESAPGRRVRITVLRALEPLADPRAASIAREALVQGGDLGVAAVPVLRALLKSPHAASEQASLDALLAVALDDRAERRLRLAATEALQIVPDVRDRLPREPEAAGGAGTAAHVAVWRDALDGRLPDDPGALRVALATHGRSAPLGEIHRLIDRVRAREADEAGRDREAWRALRGSAHHTLALRGSRVAIADLRDAIGEAAPDLPSSFLSAAQAIGDASILAPLAASYAAHDDPRWRGQVAAAFRVIVARERMTRRHGALKRILNRWPEIADHLTGR